MLQFVNLDLVTRYNLFHENVLQWFSEFPAPKFPAIFAESALLLITQIPDHFSRKADEILVFGKFIF